MRVHIELDDALVARVDKMAGARNRSRFMREAIAAALEEEARWDLIMTARGSIGEQGHEWDADPGAWVRRQRTADTARVG
ncbi:MAG: ribbon-helix-helix protein, CopG family [Candidatus Dormibacteria bacterium]